jgi:hypothetical protein
MKKNSIKLTTFAVAALVLGAYGFSQTNTNSVNRTSALKLKDLYRISNANAEGDIKCSENGSQCTFTDGNGNTLGVAGKKN